MSTDEGMQVDTTLAGEITSPVQAPLKDRSCPVVY